MDFPSSPRRDARSRRAPRITAWPEDERPREKLLKNGPATLSDAELLAIFLRTGVAGKSAVDLARELLAGFGGLRPLLNASRTDFCAGQGLGDAKYAQLQAVLEMARRHLREVFLALFLDTRHRLIAAEELFLGTLGEAVVHPREVVRRAMHHNASALIVAHNHPSGVAEPSRADEVVTLRLKEALGMVDVRLLDHFVVGDGETVSLAERGLL